MVYRATRLLWKSPAAAGLSTGSVSQAQWMLDWSVRSYMFASGGLPVWTPPYFIYHDENNWWEIYCIPISTMFILLGLFRCWSISGIQMNEFTKWQGVIRLWRINSGVCQHDMWLTTSQTIKFAQFMFTAFLCASSPEMTFVLFWGRTQQTVIGLKCTWFWSNKLRPINYRKGSSYPPGYREVFWMNIELCQNVKWRSFYRRRRSDFSVKWTFAEHWSASVVQFEYWISTSVIYF
jgi:hypothetical protein